MTEFTRIKLFRNENNIIRRRRAYLNENSNGISLIFNIPRRKKTTSAKFPSGQKKSKFWFPKPSKIYRRNKWEKRKYLYLIGSARSSVKYWRKYCFTIILVDQHYCNWLRMCDTGSGCNRFPNLYAFLAIGNQILKVPSIKNDHPPDSKSWTLSYP